MSRPFPLAQRITTLFLDLNADEAATCLATLKAIANRKQAQSRPQLAKVTQAKPKAKPTSPKPADAEASAS